MLIERTRTAVTDDTGHYRIEALRAGTYRVRFTLGGWVPLEKDGIELTGSFTAVVDARLEIQPVTTTVTVRAETPVVDVRSATPEVAYSGRLVQSLPTVRSYNALLTVIPGVVTSVNDTVTSTATTSFPIHGGRINESRLTLDGFNVGSPPSGNSATSWWVDVGDVAETSFVSAAATGESETSGLVMNIVPRAGANTTRASLFVGGTGARLQSDNLTPTLAAQGVTAATPLTKVYDVSGGIGGPILKDRLWYFVNAHTGGSSKESAKVFYNLNAGNGNAWLYVPDPTRREYLRSDLRERERAHDVAAVAAQSDQRVLGRAVAVPPLYLARRPGWRSLSRSRPKRWACSGAR